MKIQEINSIEQLIEVVSKFNSINEYLNWTFTTELNDKFCMTYEKAAESLDVSVDTIQDLIKKGELVTINLTNSRKGKRVLISSIHDLIKRGVA